MSKEIRYVEIKVSTNAGKEIGKGTAAATGMGAALKGVAGSAAMATGGIRAMTTALISSGVGAFVVAIGAAIAALRSIITTSSEFEFQTDKLKAVTEATTEQMELFKKESMRLGASTEYTATQVAQLQTEFAKLGFTTQEIINATDATLDLATAAGVDLAEAARVTGSTLAAFGLDTVETGRLIDVMAKSFSSSALDMSKFSGGITQAAAAANAMDVSVEQTVAAMSLLNNAGIEGSKVGTDLRKIFGEISKTTGKDFRRSLDDLAVSMEGVNSNQEKMDILTEAVGERSKIALSILIEQRGKLDELTTSYEGAEGAVAAMAATMRDNAKTNADLVTSAWQGMLLAIEDGDGVIQKAVDGSLNLLANTLTALTDMIDYAGTVGSAQLTNLGLGFDKMWNDMQIGAMEALNVMDRFFGRDINTERLKSMADLGLETQAILKQMAGNEAQAWLDLLNKRTAAEKTAAGERIATVVEEETAITNEEAKAAEDRKKARLSFLEKLRKATEDFEDKTEEEKINRRRERHLAELMELEVGEKEKGELKARINAFYDDQIAAYKADQDKKAQDKKAADDQKNSDQRARDIKAQADLEREMKMQLLDDTAEVFGQETAMYKAMHALKAALKIKEILLEAGLLKAKAVADNAETAGEATKGGAKAMASGNPLKIALAVAAIAAITATSIRNMRRTKGAADKMAASVGGSAGGGGGGAQAPSFNILGATSAGENLIAASVNNSNSKPIKAYVVDSEVTSTQDLTRRVESIASF